MNVDSSLKTILVIESNKVEQIYYKSVLSKHYACPIFTVDNNRDAIKIIEKNHLDLIFIDISCPGLNGLGILETLRDRNHEFEAPIIAILEDYDQNLIDRIISLGVTEYLVKPLNTGSIFKNLGIVFN
jgi:CheY-like chemotaxis protein